MAQVERRMHSEAFKRRIVARVMKGTKSVEEIAEAASLSPSMIHAWKRDERYGGDPKLFPKRATAAVELPQRKRNGLIAKQEKHWKFCPNCGERLK